MSGTRNTAERTARKQWDEGFPGAAMQTLRAGGYDETGRTDFLHRVLGLPDSTISDLEAWRDSYLDSLEEEA